MKTLELLTVLEYEYKPAHELGLSAGCQDYVEAVWCLETLVQMGGAERQGENYRLVVPSHSRSTMPARPNAGAGRDVRYASQLPTERA